MNTHREFSENAMPANWEDFKKFKHYIQNEAVTRLERKFLMDALRLAEGNVSKAAKNIGMQRTNFHSLLQKYNIKS